MNAYDIGDVVRFTVNTRSITGNLVDPGVLKFRVNEPDGTIIEHVYSEPGSLVVRVDEGIYQIDLPMRIRGRHRYAWSASGVHASYEEHEYTVRTRRVLAV